MPQQVFGAAAAVSILNRAFYNASPSNDVFTNQVAEAGNTVTSQAAFAQEFAKGFESLSAEDFAELVLGNMGLLPNDELLEAAILEVEARPVQERGMVVLDLGKILASLENATGAQEIFRDAAVAWNNEVGASYSYSSNPENTQPYEGEFGNGSSDNYTLTGNADKATANVFDAPQVYTPGGDHRINSLQNDDVLTGRGENATLNAVLGNRGDNGATVVTPTLKGIETINARFDSTTGSMTLDLQDATGVKHVNITRVADGSNATVGNIADKVESLSISNSNAPNNNISFSFLKQAVAGKSDAVELKLSNVDVNNVFVEERGNAPTEGFETIDLVSTGSGNSANTLFAQDLQTLNISGDADLSLQGSGVIRGGLSNVVEATTVTAGLGRVAGTLSKIDASELKGDITIALGAETTAVQAGGTGAKVNFQYIGAEGDDNVTLVNGMDKGDTLDLGAGNNNLTVMATTQAGSVSNAQTLTVLNQTGVANTIGVDAGIVTGLESVVVRNEGQVAGTSAASAMTANLVNLSAQVAADVTIKHGTTGNSSLVNNVLQLDGADGVTAMTVNIADGVNSQARFNFQLYTDSDLKLDQSGTVASGRNTPTSGANAVTTLNLVDGDSESNTVALTAQGYTAAGTLRTDTATSYSTINLSGGKAGQFLNLDNTANAYGVATNGNTGNATSGLANPAARDTAFASVYAATGHTESGVGAGYVLAGNGTGAADRIIATKVDASGYAGDVIMRVGQADQTITTGAGNDTIIFDAINDSRAGLTIADKVNMGAGVDTIVIDGGFTVGATNIALGASEWTNLKGVDVLRLGSNNAGNYQLTITDQLVSQTDAGDRITIINNDGNLGAQTNSAAVIDARQANGLSANKFISFYGENGDSANGAVAFAANRVILSDATANGGHILDGGDADLQAHADPALWNGSWQGNFNTIEYRNSSIVTEGDQAGIRNFNRIVFNNDQAVAQSLTLEITQKVADALADASHAATATAQESLLILANDGGVPAPLAGAALNVSAQSAGNAFRFVVFTDHGHNVSDVINLNSNIGGAAGHNVNMADGSTAPANADTLTFYGAAGEAWAATTGTVSVNGTAYSSNALTIQNSLGLATAVHTVVWDLADTIRLTNNGGTTFTTLQQGMSKLTFNGSVNADTIVGTAGDNVITGGAGADVMTGGAGNNVFNYGTLASVSAQTGITLATADTITDFVSGTDTIKTGTAGTAANYAEAAAAGTFAAAQAAADVAFNGTVVYYLTSTAADGGLLFVDSNADGTADAVIKLTGITDANFAFTDIVA